MITVRASKIFPAALLLIVAACSGSGGNFGAANNSNESEENDDEEADPPEVVTGAYLTCVDTNDAAADEISYGCNLSKSNGKSINLTDIATQWKWQAVPPKNADYKVKVIDKSQTGDRAIFLFSGEEKSGLRSFAEETQVALSLKLKEPVQGYKPFRSTIKDTSSSGALGQSSNTSDTTSNNTKLQIPTGSPATGTVAGGPQPEKLPELPLSIPDQDKDGVADTDDLCSYTKTGKNVWKAGEWRGCSEGEYKDSDDLDRDSVPNSVDICSTTPNGMVVDSDPASPTYGCASSEIFAP